MATPYSKMTPEQKKRSHAANKRHKKKNPEKAAQWKHTHYMNNRAKYLAIERERAMVKRYGVTMEKYLEMLDAQGAKCLICGSDKPDRNGHFEVFAIDHDHVTGKVRGLLCIKCNSCLGWYEANSKSIVGYLETSSSRGN